MKGCVKSNQIKSNFFVWRLSYFKSASQWLKTTMIKHTNPPTPINTQRDTETYRDTHPHPHTRTHTCTHKHTSSDPLHLFERDMARHRDLRCLRKKPPLKADHTERAPGPRLQGAPPQRQPRPGQTRGPTPRCRALQPPGPEQSTGQHPCQWTNSSTQCGRPP